MLANQLRIALGKRWKLDLLPIAVRRGTVLSLLLRENALPLERARDYCLRAAQGIVGAAV